MLSISLSMLAWMAVVLVQAIVYFCVLGPRSRQTEEEAFVEGDEIVGTKHDKNANSNSIKIPTYSPSTVSTTEDRNQLLSDIDEDSTCSITDSAAMIVPDERDSSEDVHRTSLLDKQDSRHDNGGISATQSRRSVTGKTMTSRKGQRSISVFSSNDNPAEEDNYDLSDCEQDDSSFDDDYVEDDDEKWRYEMLRRYYSPSSQSILPVNQYPTTAALDEKPHSELDRSGNKKIVLSNATNKISLVASPQSVNMDKKKAALPSKTYAVVRQKSAPPAMDVHRETSALAASGVRLRRRAGGDVAGPSCASRHVSFGMENRLYPMTAATHAVQ